MHFHESGAALAAAKAEIAERLRPVCDYCTEAEFERLVTRIARIEQRYQTRDLAEFFASAPGHTAREG
jgi:hypothetical protein